MLQNNRIETLIDAYHSGSLIIHNAVAVDISPTRPTLDYQTITSAFMFPISGEARIYLNNKVFLAKPGKMIYIPYATKIKVTVLSNEHFSYINLFHQLLERPLFEMDLMNIFEDVYKLLVKLVTLCQSTKSEELFQKNIGMQKLFTLLQNQIMAPKICDYAIVKDLIHYMNTHYGEDINLEKLAALAGLKKSKISYLFKKYTNKRPIDYLIHYRIKKALELLETTDLLICEVAERVGYQDPFYFSRLFKRHTGIAPTALRQQTKQVR
jgi:AraC-like DNA-binding protein